MSSFKAGNYKFQGDLEHNKMNQCLEINDNKCLDYIYFSDKMIEQNCCVQDKKNKISRFESEIWRVQNDNKNDQYQKIQQFYRADKGYLLIMNSSLYQNLHTFSKENTFSENKEKYVAIIISILFGLNKIHYNQIIYQCISPYNLKIDDNYRVIFQENTYERVFQDYSSDNLLFLAPEILENEKLKNVYGFKADVFSFGVLLYYMIYQKHPFYESEYIDRKMLIQKIKTHQIKFDQSKVIPICLIDFIKKLLQYDPSERMSWHQVYKHPFLRHYIQQLIDLQNSNFLNYNDEEKNKFVLSCQNFYKQEIFEVCQIPPIKPINDSEKPKKICIQQSNNQNNNINQRKKLKLPPPQNAIFQKAEFLSKFTKSVKELCDKLNIDCFYTEFYLLRYAIDILNQIIISFESQNVGKKVDTSDKQQIQKRQKKLLEKIQKNHLTLQRQFSENQLIGELSTCFQDFKKEYVQNLQRYIKQMKSVLERPQDEDKLGVFTHIMLAFEALNIQKNDLKDEKDFNQYKNQLKQYTPEQWESIINDKLKNS
ncbi:hypothetical protein ABPG74_009450 [Tetrahymena malaccensis]